MLGKRNERRTQFASSSGDKKAAQKFQQDAVGNDNRAVQYFESSLELARTQNDRASVLRSLLGLLRLYHRQGRDERAVVNTTLQQALVVLEQLPDSRDKAYAAIQLANLLQLVTQQALVATVADESLYLWAWQAGRLFKAQGRVSEAIDFSEFN